MDIAPSVLWTAMPMELIAPQAEMKVPPCVEQEVQGRILQVIPAGDGTGTVQRLISGDPMDYLDVRWQPGARIRMV